MSARAVQDFARSRADWPERVRIRRRVADARAFSVGVGQAMIAPLLNTGLLPLPAFSPVAPALSPPTMSASQAPAVAPVSTSSSSYTSTTAPPDHHLTRRDAFPEARRFDRRAPRPCPLGAQSR